MWQSTPRGEHGIKDQGKRVLVVEDSPTQAAQIRALLTANSLRVLLANDGVEGLEQALEALPDLIILDFEMPRMNGAQLVHELKKDERTRRIPVIIFTRHDSPEALSLGLEEGVVDFIPKDAFAKVVMIETLKEMGFIKPAGGM